MELLSKITVKTVGCQPKKGSIEVAKALFTVYGIARGYKMGVSNFGEFITFKGDIEAKNQETGEVYRSSNLILPNLISGMLQGAIDGSPDSDIEVALIVGVKPSDTPMGYEYTIKPLMEMKEADSLVALRALVNDKLKALPAPDKAEGEKGKGKK